MEPWFQPLTEWGYGYPGYPGPPQFWAEDQVTEVEPCLWTFASFGHAPAQTWKGWKGRSLEVQAEGVPKEGAGKAQPLSVKKCFWSVR